MEENGRRIVCNDDGWILSNPPAPVTVDVLKERMVDTWVGSSLDTLSWCVGDTSVQEYETKELISGVTKGTLPGEGSNRAQENLCRLIQTAGGPLTVLTKLCHEAGFKILPSLRMNSHYDTATTSAALGTIRENHPEYLIGLPREEIAEKTVEWGIRTGLNYARPEVRAHVAAIILDLFERFDTDGVELDFMRHPAFFRVEEAYANRHLVTDMLCYVRKRMQGVSGTTGRDLELLVRVPPTPSDSARIGLDVEAWIREGLVDTVVAGGGFIPQHAPVEEFIGIARGTDCRILGSLESLRLAADEEAVNALASRFNQAGACGIYLFNYWHKSSEWKGRNLTRLSSPAALARADKRYDMEYMERLIPNDLHSYAFRYAIPPVQLPVILTETLARRGPTLRITIGDDVAAAAADGALKKCTLKLGLENYTIEDELEVWVNGTLLSMAHGRASFGRWSRQEWTEFPNRVAEVSYVGGVLAYDLDDPPLRRGENEIEIRLIMRTVTQPVDLVLKDLELSIEYEQ